MLKSLIESYKRDNPNPMWCEIDRSINRTRTSPSQIGASIDIWTQDLSSHNFPQKASSRSMMAARKRIINDGTSKGKAIATTGATTPPPTKNQLHTEDTGSFSLQEPDVHLSQQCKNQLLHTLYEMREQMKKQPSYFDREREQMALNRKNILRE